MNTYELTVVIDGKATPAKKKKVVEKIEELLKVFKGSIKKQDDWGRLELAYKIKKADTGVFLFFEIELDGAGAKQLGTKIKMEADILRHLMVRK